LLVEARGLPPPALEGNAPSFPRKITREARTYLGCDALSLRRKRRSVSLQCPAAASRALQPVFNSEPSKLPFPENQHFQITRFTVFSAVNSLGPLSTDSWTLAQLGDATARIYLSSGFSIERRQLPAPGVFLSEVSPGVTVCVGCMVKNELQLITKLEVQNFWRSVQRQGWHGAVLVTTGGFEQSAIDFAAIHKITLVDRPGLIDAVGALSPEHRAQLLSPTSPEAHVPALPVAAPPRANVESIVSSARAMWSSVSDSRRPWPVKWIAGGIVILIAGATFWFGFPQVRAQLVEGVQTKFIDPVLNPLPEGGLESATPLSRPISEPSAGLFRKGEEPMVNGITESAMRLLIHRTSLLEALKQRKEDEALAAEILEVTQAAKAAGVDYVEHGLADVHSIVSLANQGFGLHGETAGRPGPYRPPGLTEDELDRLEPYLDVKDRELVLNPPPIQVEDLLIPNPPALAYDSAETGFDASLQTLAQRLYAEEAVEDRRRAQSIAALVDAAQSVGYDLVAKFDGNLDAIVDGLVAGQTLEDPANPFNGQTFAAGGITPERLAIVKQFLRVQNGRVRYHERIRADTFPEVAIDLTDGDAAARRAIADAEELIRGTAQDILVKSATRSRNLMPVSGL